MLNIYEQLFINYFLIKVKAKILIGRNGFMFCFDDHPYVEANN